MLATIGIHTIIPVETSGAHLPYLECGDIIISVAGLRRDVVSYEYTVTILREQDDQIRNNPTSRAFYPWPKYRFLINRVITSITTKIEE